MHEPPLGRATDLESRSSRPPPLPPIPTILPSHYGLASVMPKDPSHSIDCGKNDHRLILTLGLWVCLGTPVWGSRP